MSLIGLFGGTFDPIHNGHLALAKAGVALGLSKVVFIPVAHPPHRAPPIASATHRIEMIKRAIAPNPQFELSLVEHERAGPSYMVDTLAHFRANHGPEQPLALMTGGDALSTIDRWHRWQALLDFAHIIAFTRQDHEIILPEGLPPLAADSHALTQCPHGQLYIHTVKLPQVSSTAIRAGQSSACPLCVTDYIATQHLY